MKNKKSILFILTFTDSVSSRKLCILRNAVNNSTTVNKRGGRGCKLLNKQFCRLFYQNSFKKHICWNWVSETFYNALHNLPNYFSTYPKSEKHLSCHLQAALLVQPKGDTSWKSSQKRKIHPNSQIILCNIKYENQKRQYSTQTL